MRIRIYHIINNVSGFSSLTIFKMNTKVVEPSRKKAVATLKKRYGKNYFSDLAKKKAAKEKVAKAKAKKGGKK